MVDQKQISYTVIDSLKQVKQVLTGETESNDTIVEDTEANEVHSEDEGSSKENTPNIEVVSGHKRIRRKPVRANDYILSTCRSGPNIKKTPKKQSMSILNSGEEADTVECSICKNILRRGNSYFFHVMFCTDVRLKYETCGRKFKERNYLLKHWKGFHSNPTTGFVPRKERMMKRSATATTDKSCEA